MLKLTRDQKPYKDHIYLKRIDDLHAHEGTDPNLIDKLMKEMVSSGILRKAVTVDENTQVILNGTHRYEVLKLMGCRLIPVVYVNYNSPDIVVTCWRDNSQISKKEILEAGLSGRKLPPKSSKHLIRRGNSLFHISTIEKRVDVPLDLLKSDLELINIHEVKTAMYANFDETLTSYMRFLKTGIVDVPLILDKATSILLGGYDAFYALDLLSANKAPALRVDIDQLGIKFIHSSKEITKQLIIDAGLRGPKLPPNSFKLNLEPLKISVPLKDLMGYRDASKKSMRVFESTVELLYENWPTPLVKLRSFSIGERSVWAKLESYNPFSNSIKDRVGWAMIFDALERGELKNVLYEATSTNTGIALASIANTLGIKSKLFIPEAVQKTSDVYLDVLGAEVIRLPVGLTVEALGIVDAEAKAHGGSHLNQFENDANFKVHLKYTAREIDEQLKSLGLQPTCIIGGLGTSGHMSAIAFYFKSKYGDNVKIIGVQPAPNEVIPGIRRIETGMKWLHRVRFDEIVDVTQSEAIEGVIKIARNEGLLIGLSAGAVVNAFQKIAENRGVYVLIFPDSGYKYAEYFEKHFFEKR